MSYRCKWPRCRREGGGSIEGKVLCEYHMDRVLSENDSVAANARKIMKLSPPEYGGRIPKWEELNTKCCFEECNRMISTFMGDKPLCSDHRHLHETIEYNGPPKTVPAREVEYEVESEEDAALSSELESLLERGVFD